MTTTVTLTDGPLDGEALDISGLTDDEAALGVALPAPGCTYPGGRALYSPRDDGVWRWDGDTP